MTIILAVSGGVDSVAMLHSLVAKDGFAKTNGFPTFGVKPRKGEVGKLASAEIVVAHFDHGLRPDSAGDARFVEGLAKAYGLEFVSHRGELADSSEVTARNARWGFLRSLAGGEEGVIATAHHKDDAVETMCINILRGTNRTGLTPFATANNVVRPLLSRNKNDIYEYAIANKLEFVEDGSNNTDDYLRNRVRRYVVPQLRKSGEYKQLLDIRNKLMATNSEIDSCLRDLLDPVIVAEDSWVAVTRSFIGNIPDVLLPEVIRYIVAKLQYPNISTEQYLRIVEFLRSKNTGKQFQVGSGLCLIIEKDYIKVIT